MNYIDSINKLLKTNAGMVTTAQITEANIPRIYLKRMVDSGQLIRTGRGVYTLPDALEDEMFILQVKYNKGIFSHGTALFLHDLTDRTPIQYTMTFPVGYHVRSLKDEDLKSFHVKKELFDLGAITMLSPYGKEISVYNIERTICDILKGRSNMDIQIVTDTMKRYARSRNKNIPLLTQYAKMFRVEGKVRQYLEVLL